MAKELTILTAEYSTYEVEDHPIHHQRRPIKKPSLAANLTEDQARESSPNQSQIYVNLGALDTYKQLLQLI